MTTTRAHRFAVGDKLSVGARMGDYEITVKRLDWYGTAPIYWFDSKSHGREMWCEDRKCSHVAE